MTLAASSLNNIQNLSQKQDNKTENNINKLDENEDLNSNNNFKKTPLNDEKSKELNNDNLSKQLNKKVDIKSDSNESNFLIKFFGSSNF